MPEKTEHHTASNYYVSQFYHLAVRRGLDGESLLKQAGISPDIIDSPSRRVDTEQLARVVMAVWDLMQDESMSLSSSPIPRGSFYMMGKLGIHEPNLGKSLRMAIRLYDMVTQAFRADLEIEGDRAVLRFLLKSPELDEQHLLTEINLMAWHRFSSWLIAENITLIDVYFAYPRPPQVGEYNYLFPGKHHFDAEFTGFSFHKKFLERENVQNSDSLKAFMKRCPVELFLQPKTDFSLSGELQLLLNKRARDGFPSIEEAANILNMTKRTIIRKLNEEGASYQEIKNLVRRDRAIYFLTRHTLSVGEVSEKVGFSDPAVFARAFKNWTGLSPREYRLNFAQFDTGK